MDSFLDFKDEGKNLKDFNHTILPNSQENLKLFDVPTFKDLFTQFPEVFYIYGERVCIRAKERKKDKLVKMVMEREIGREIAKERAREEKYKEQFLIDSITFLLNARSPVQKISKLEAALRDPRTIRDIFNAKNLDDCFLRYPSLFSLHAKNINLKSKDEAMRFVKLVNELKLDNPVEMEAVTCDVIRDALKECKVLPLKILGSLLPPSMSHWLGSTFGTLSNFIYENTNRLNIIEHRGFYRLLDGEVPLIEYTLLDEIVNVLKEKQSCAVSKLSELLQKQYKNYIREKFGNLDCFLLFHYYYFYLKDKVVRLKKNPYQPHLPYSKIKQGIDEGLYKVSTIRGHPRDTRMAFSTVEGYNHDVEITGFKNLNSALDGDKVVLQIFPKSQWIPIAEFDEIDEIDEEAIVDFKEKEEVDDEELKEQEKPKETIEIIEEIEEERIDVDSDFDTVSSASYPEKADSPSLAPEPQETSQESAPGTPEKPENLKPTGRVVFILERSRNKYVGTLTTPKPGKKKKINMAIFKPISRKLPAFVVDYRECPEDFMQNPAKYKLEYFTLKFKYWSRGPNPVGTDLKRLGGRADDLVSSTKAILEGYGIDPTPIDEIFPIEIPPEGIDEKEIKQRKDLRDKRIFTIDPPTAKDMDDAVSIQKLSNGNYEVGVHIADVTHYVPVDSLLDRIAREKATSVYLVHSVIPMILPKLSEDLCSLMPKVTRCAVSVIWELKADGEIVNTWIGRTVIQSCVKLAYGDAQLVIDNKAAGVAAIEAKRPTHPSEGIAEDIILLNGIAKRLRDKRLKNGAMNFNRKTLRFILDDSKKPIGFEPEAHANDANKLIEEFMLLANMTVAETIYSKFPQQTLLRAHKSPNPKKLKRFTQFCKQFNFKIDLSSSAALASSLEIIKKQHPDKLAIAEMLEDGIIRSMQTAEYICTSSMDPDDFHHWALNVDYYTHFTSPIRRYPDIIVHRLILAAIGNTPDVPSTLDVINMAAHCTQRQKDVAQLEREVDNLYLAFILSANPATDNDCIVIRISNNYIQIFSPLLSISCDLDVSKYRYEYIDSQKKANIYPRDLSPVKQPAKKMYRQKGKQEQKVSTDIQNEMPSVSSADDIDLVGNDVNQDRTQFSIQLLSVVTVRFTLQSYTPSVTIAATLVHPIEKCD